MRILKKEKFSENFTRYTIFGCKYFGIFIHRISGFDDACEHDHPWDFYSFMLRGGYVEYYNGKSRIINPGRLVFRPAEFKHRLEIHQPSWTLVLVFKTKREWGYWDSNGFIPVDKYERGQKICK